MRRLDRVEAAALAALAGLSVLVLAALLTKGRALTGADGLLASDQLQYFTWIRQAGEHGLVGNEYDLAPDHRVFLHPGFLLSGLLHEATGITVPLSYLLWKPVAVVLLFWGVPRLRAPAAPARRRAPRGADPRRVLRAAGERARRLDRLGRQAAPVHVRLHRRGAGLGAVPVGLPDDGDRRRADAARAARRRGLAGAAERARAKRSGASAEAASRSPRRARCSSPGCSRGRAGRSCSSWRRPRRIAWRRSGERPAGGILVVLAAACAPAAYYAVLERTDAAWELAGQVNAAGNQATWSWPWWAIALTLAPLAVPAALAYRTPAATWQDLAARVWPLAALAVYLAPVGTFPYHAFQGMAIPLAVLAVQGVRSRLAAPARMGGGRGARAARACPAPRTASRWRSTRSAPPATRTSSSRGEQDALDFLAADPRPGGVLAPAYGGHMLPYRTGREVYVGALSWTPDWDARVRETRALFEGDLPPAAAQALARRSGARFAFVDCRPGLRDLRPVLGDAIARVRPFGCATVYELRP